MTDEVAAKPAKVYRTAKGAKIAATRARKKRMKENYARASARKKARKEAARMGLPDPFAVRVVDVADQIGEAQAEALLMEMAKELQRSESGRKLDEMYRAVWPHVGGPYPWQVEFHNAGGSNRQRAIVAANRVGKTRTVAAEVAMHLTGLYPEWWVGRRFAAPVDFWVAGNTNQDVRDIQQLELLGRVEEGRIPSGEGWVPRSCIGKCSFRQCGVTNVVDVVQIKHVSGGWSSLGFKSFEQKAIAFQGTAKHGIWLDEEPENDTNNEIFGECLIRLMTTDGILLFSRTPLFGNTAIVQHFINGGKGIWFINVGWDQAPHMTLEHRQEFLASVPEHQRDTRSKGVPMMGSGGVYPISDEEISCDPFEIPRYFRRICGIDFGIDHPGAACWLAHDTDSDTVYVYDCYKKSGETAAYHSTAINARGKWIPVAWPHDGMTRDKGGGVALKDLYQQHGVNMLGVSARYDDDKAGGQAREPITIEILERMRTGRFKVFRHLNQWFEEKRMLHRKDGKIVAVNDDIESATRYGMMMLRCAVSKGESDTPKPSLSFDASYDPLSVEPVRSSPYVRS